MLRRIIGQPQLAIIILTISLGFLFRAGAGFIWGHETQTFETPFTNRVINAAGVILPLESSGTVLLAGLLYLFFNFHQDPVKRINSLILHSGYVGADIIVKALEAAGRDLTRPKFLAALESIKDYKPFFQGPTLSYGPDKHQGSTATLLAKVEAAAGRSSPRTCSTERIGQANMQMGGCGRPWFQQAGSCGAAARATGPRARN